MGLSAVRKTAREAPEDWAAPGGEDALAGVSGAEGWRSAVVRVLSKDSPVDGSEETNSIPWTGSDAMKEPGAVEPEEEQAKRDVTGAATRPHLPEQEVRHQPVP